MRTGIGAGANTGAVNIMAVAASIVVVKGEKVESVIKRINFAIPLTPHLLV